MNLALFMLVGYETTSTTLSLCSYVLARHPEEQDALYNDISNYFPEDSNIEPEIDTVSKCEYLEMFIKEVLRMYPIAIK
jgi:cytochrome P450 family 3 subfamily A